MTARKRNASDILLKTSRYGNINDVFIIKSDQTLYTTYGIGFADPSQLVIEEGGQVVIGEESSNVTQTINLETGWNYCSFNVDITLNDLKAALVEAMPGTAIMIKGQYGNTNYDPARNRWLGNVTWDLSKMYKIKTTADCTITFEGMPIDAASHTITIKNGANWIAYPLGTSKSLTDAFAGFAVNGDMIKSQDGTATYARGRWQGTSLTTLEPGEGYIYKSSLTNDRPFTFPISTK